MKALERPVVQPPEPPDYELKCDPDENNAADAQIDAYEKALFSKETDAIQRLLGAALTLIMLTGDINADQSGLSLAQELVGIGQFRKVNSLFSHYSGNPKKMVAVTRVAFSVDRQYQLLGGTEQTEWFQQVQSWAGRVKEYYFDKLRNEHDYSMVSVVFQVERQLGLLGVNIDNDGFYTELANAMTFKVTMDITLDATASTGAAHDEAKGDVTVTADPNLVFPLSGSGTIDYQPSYDGPLTLVPGQSFTENVRVDNFDACKNMTASIFRIVFGADMETYTYDGFDFPVGSPLTETGEAVFVGYLGQDGSYAFPVTL